MNRVTNISWRTTNGATLGGFAYEYDAIGRIVSRSHALGDPSFDRVNACVATTPSSSEDFRARSDGDGEVSRRGVRRALFEVLH